MPEVTLEALLLDGTVDSVAARNAAITAAVNALKAGAPAAFDTLVELAAAFQNDPDIVQDILDAIALKQPLHANLTLLAAVSAQDYGRQLLNLGDAAGAREHLNVLSSIALGAEPGRARRIVDCGEIDATALIPGPQTVFTPATGELVTHLILVPDLTDLLAGTMDVAFGTVVGQGDNGAGSDWINWSMGNTNAQIQALETPNDDQVLAGANTGLLAPILPWQAGHVYADIEGVIEEGHIWYADPGGTSGGTIPDFAQGIIDGSVVDGAITWFDDDEPPSAGTARAYVVVDGPVAVQPGAQLAKQVWTPGGAVTLTGPTSVTDFDAANAAITFTPVGPTATVEVSATFRQSLTADVYYSLREDSTEKAVRYSAVTAGAYVPTTIKFHVAGLTAGVPITLKLAGQANAGNLTLEASAVSGPLIIIATAD